MKNEVSVVKQKHLGMHTVFWILCKRSNNEYVIVVEKKINELLDVLKKEHGYLDIDWFPVLLMAKASKQTWHNTLELVQNLENKNVR